VQATAVYFISFARLAEPDMILTAIIVAAVFVFAWLHSIGSAWPRPPRHLAMLFWVLVGLSNMVKGLGFGPFVILAPCLAYLILKHDQSAWRKMISWPGFLLAVAIAVAWPLAVVTQAPEGRELWRNEIAKRATGGVGYEQAWWYYLETAPWQLLPWTGALLIAAWPSLKRARWQPDSPDRFIWIWALVPIVLLSFFRGKHHHYIISSLCAFSPLCAIGLLRFGSRIAMATAGIAVVGILYVQARVLPVKDRCRDDVEFLKSVRTVVRSGVPLGATGGQEIARAMFYVDPPPQGVFDPRDLDRYFAGKEFYLITRRREERSLKKFGSVEIVRQSKHTRAERDPSDRFTLFHVKP
jgi:4-amino-4-deoxy-L-arabinose transferase-like glycosyltransferase